MLSSWPVREPDGWAEIVNRAQSEAELESVRTSVQRGRPYGAEKWSQKTAKTLGLEGTFRPRGRPKKQPDPPNNGS